MNSVTSKSFLCLLIGAVWGYSAVADASFDKGFIESFLGHYEFSPEGRYVHEYHPFILRKTSQSFDHLEQTLRAKGFNLAGRVVILGYEEHSVPPYYTNYKEAKINDEASLRIKSGWSLKLHNRFGFMTGFLFKDINKLVNKDKRIFEHINAEMIPLFDDRASIFQEHAFGEALPLIEKTRSCVEHEVKNNRPKGVFIWLEKFWNYLYKDAFKVGNNQIAGTQDILFSIEYARHVISSPLSLFKYFIGPDITYPIEIFSKQEKEVTRNAQKFVKNFVSNLEPRDNQSTVYIFCSFVDGVGKSTMLGNIKNWMRFGEDVEKFQHVDNSSSQLAEVFLFKDKVYIADLPAQVSHFSYKPDGLVYVDAQTAYTNDQLKEVRQLVHEHYAELEKHYKQALVTVADIMKQKGALSDELNDVKSPALTFIKNVLLLKKEKDNRWIPCTYKDTHYLFNRENTAEIRFLTPLSEVKSEGLKNIESEQMLFFDGIRFPLPYSVFVNDLVEKLQIRGIKKIVFVDFLSMYPRSSRENVRINYLLQQQALIDHSFDVKCSIYREFVSGGELLYYLQSKRTSDRVLAAFKLESLIRLVLCKLIVERKEGDLSGIKIQPLTTIIQEKLAALDEKTKTLLDEWATKKVHRELIYLEKLYGLSKSFINIQKLSLPKICAFSKLTQDYFANQLRNESLNYLWQDPGSMRGYKYEKAEQYSDTFVSTDLGRTVRLCSLISSECKTEFLLAPFLRTLRASWYASLANFLNVSKEGEDFVIKDEIFLVPPLFVKQAEADTVCLIQRSFDTWEGEYPKSAKILSTLFHIPPNGRVGDFGGRAYSLDWNSRVTHTNLFAFDCDIDKKKKTNGYIPLVTRFVQKYQNENGFGSVMPTAELGEKMEKSVYWEMDWSSMVRQAEKNGLIDFDAQKKSEDADKKAPYRLRKEIYLGRPEQVDGAQALVTMLATLEMIAKDPDADIVVRDGNRDDFKAALWLLEKITLPKYFGILFKENLFDDYDAEEPYPSWDYWDNIAE